MHEDLSRHRCDPNDRRALRDVHGIFCTFVCDKCEAAKREGFRPEIFTDPDYGRSEPIEDE